MLEGYPSPYKKQKRVLNKDPLAREHSNRVRVGNKQELEET